MKRMKGEQMEKERGQAMVEFALILPFLLMLLCGILDFGYILSRKNDLTHLSGGAARECAIQAASGNSEVAAVAQTYVGGHATGGGVQVKSAVQTAAGSASYVTVTLTEKVRYLTGFTGVITGGHNDIELESTASWPVEP